MKKEGKDRRKISNTHDHPPPPPLSPSSSHLIVGCGVPDPPADGDGPTVVEAVQHIVTGTRDDVNKVGATPVLKDVPGGGEG